MTAGATQDLLFENKIFKTTRKTCICMILWDEINYAKGSAYRFTRKAQQPAPLVNPSLIQSNSYSLKTYHELPMR